MGDTTHSLFILVDSILDDIIDKKNQDIFQDATSMLKAVMQKIEQREKENMKELNRYKSREKMYQWKIRSLEILASTTIHELESVMKQFQQVKIEKSKIEEEKLEQQDLIRHFINFQSMSLQELRLTYESIKQQVLQTKKVYAKECHNFGVNLGGLIHAAHNYHRVLEENRKLYNDIQDLKGNIRVCVRIRPFLPEQSDKQATVQSIGENGELVVKNPGKEGKDRHMNFKFNKVFCPTATQEEVFLDIKPLIRSVLDGYNVCICAYGQTGSGKTYTMVGPNVTSNVDRGVNYRALDDLFSISRNRHGSVAYQIGVQMIEVYNEQVYDLLSDDVSQKRLGIRNTSQPNGLIVPNASMHHVKSTSDVLALMNIGSTNRTVGATALNERSSRSHSVLTVHVRGTDLETNAVFRGCLHLVDLAGSERVDRSEASGERLREAQHINKSLSALGDVIFALSQKGPHVPYRNSKLTQVLQSSLGGQAKTLMLIQLNPDVESYSETISTLKFAERVSGVELGAARRNKEGRGIGELMEQIASPKDDVAKKDEEIGRLRFFQNYGKSERCGTSSSRYISTSPRRPSLGASRPSQTLSGGKSSSEKCASDLDNISEYREKHFEAGSRQSIDDFRHHKEFFRRSRLAVVGADENFHEDVGLKLDLADGVENLAEDIELLGLGDADSEERLSDISDSGLSIPETVEPTADTAETPKVPAKLPRPAQKQKQAGSSGTPTRKSSSKLSSFKRSITGNSYAQKSSKRWV